MQNNFVALKSSFKKNNLGSYMQEIKLQTRNCFICSNYVSVIVVVYYI